VPYLDNYWSVSFGPKCDPLVFDGLHLDKYFDNLSNFISHTIPNFQKHRSLTMATLQVTYHNWQWLLLPGPHCTHHAILSLMHVAVGLHFTHFLLNIQAHFIKFDIFPLVIVATT
jgi:hypothetical protein